MARENHSKVLYASVKNYDVYNPKIEKLVRFDFFLEFHESTRSEFRPVTRDRSERKWAEAERVIA